MKRFTELELFAGLPKSQIEMSKRALKNDPDACMMCGIDKGRQILLNGLPAQLCEDCIGLQKEKYNSEPQEICGNCLHPVVLNAEKAAIAHLANDRPMATVKGRKPLNGPLISNECNVEGCNCHHPIAWHN